MKVLRIFKSLAFGLVVMGVVGCGQETPKLNEDEILLPLKLGEDNTLSLHGPILQNIFAYSHWLKQNEVREISIESYTDNETAENNTNDEAPEVLCAEMVKSLLVTQGIPENRMNTVIVKYEDAVDGEDMQKAMEESEFTCLVRVKAEKK